MAPNTVYKTLGFKLLIQPFCYASAGRMEPEISNFSYA